ncbi:tetratricopeptide repeat protein, partial [Streptomyces sp. NPDC087440]
MARVGLEVADQTASVVGGTAAVLGIGLSLALRERPNAEPATEPPGGSRRAWVPAAAVEASLRPPVVQVPVRGRGHERGVLAGLVKGAGGLVVVCGAGGLGKTTLAAAAAEDARVAGKRVFWVRWQDSPAQLADSLTRMAQDLGLTDTRLEDARRGGAALVDVVWEHLGACTGWVIVVDNVDTPGHIGPGVEPVDAYRGWLRADGPGLVVVTSRDTTAATWGAQAHLVRLEPLEEQPAGVVLCDAAPAAGTGEEGVLLGVRLGGLPLALNAAGRYLAEPTSRYRTFTAYRQALETEFGDLVGAENGLADDPDVARTLVRHTWELSLDQLERDAIPHARPLLRLLALLEGAPIPRTLITPPLLSGLTHTQVSPVALDAAFAGLDRYGLLGTPHTTSRSPAPGGAGAGGESVVQVVLHPLIREIMALPQPATSPAAPDADAERARWYTVLDTHLAQTVHDVVAAGRTGWPTAQLLAPHLPAHLDRAPASHFITTRNLLDALASALGDAGMNAAELVLRTHVAVAEAQALGPDHPDTLTSRNNLAT